MSVKIRVAIVFGGRSGEHEVSVRSATSIFNKLNREKYEVILAGVDKLGTWHKIDANWLPQGPEMKAIGSGDKSLVPQELGGTIDVFFPIIHGPMGEDGTLQGLFELLNVAYVGAGVLGSAVGMDKDVMKRLLLQSKLPIGRYVVYPQKHNFKYPVFVKPANMGSSVGVTKAKNKAEETTAVKEALKYDTKVLIEEAIVGRELEISVLGNDNPIASLPGEVKATHEFYDYEAKYLDENGAILEIPAKLTKSQVINIQKIAIAAFKALDCKGMARVDMFMTKKGKIIINEINTLPGFTSISMYPKLWEATGLKYADLLDKLIELALEDKARKDKLLRSYG